MRTKAPGKKRREKERPEEEALHGIDTKLKSFIWRQRRSFIRCRSRRRRVFKPLIVALPTLAFLSAIAFGKMSFATKNFRFAPLAIAGAWLIDSSPQRDERGYFLRLFCADEFAEAGLETNFRQRSTSLNPARGTLRGLHFQLESHAETKIVRCLHGAIFDVIVDLRPNQPTFKSWLHVELRGDLANMLYIPPGCAHGFMTLEENCEVYYEITPAYRPESAAGIVWSDPDLAIAWPLKPSVIGERDRMMPTLKAYLSAQAEGARL